MLDRIPTHLILTAEELYQRMQTNRFTIRVAQAEHQEAVHHVLVSMMHHVISDREFAWQRKQVIDRQWDDTPSDGPMIYR